MYHGKRNINPVFKVVFTQRDCQYTTVLRSTVAGYARNRPTGLTNTAAASEMPAAKIHHRSTEFLCTPTAKVVIEMLKIKVNSVSLKISLA